MIRPMMRYGIEAAWRVERGNKQQHLACGDFPGGHNNSQGLLLTGLVKVPAHVECILVCQSCVLDAGGKEPDMGAFLKTVS